MKRGVLVVGAALGTAGAALLAAGYGAAGALACVLAFASVAVALSVTWRLDEGDGPALPTGGGLPRA